MYQWSYFQTIKWWERRKWYVFIIISGWISEYFYLEHETTEQSHLSNETTIEDNKDNAQSFEFDVSIGGGDISVVSQSGEWVYINVCVDRSP